MSRLLHVSDSYVDGESGPDGVERVVDRAVALEVDCVVHGGNLFRRPTPDETTVERVANAVEPLADAGIPLYTVD
ncbi:MAG: hypothetical protein ABEI75_00645, partial [Halobaculum sp.]